MEHGKNSIFVQYSESEPIAQLFNFDCTKIPGTGTRLDHLKKGKDHNKRWDEYASPELLEYVDKGQSALSTALDDGLVRLSLDCVQDHALAVDIYRQMALDAYEGDQTARL